MLDICNHFAHDKFMTLDSKRTVCIKYGELIQSDENAKLDGKLLKWKTDIRYLGNNLIVHLIIQSTVILYDRVLYYRTF